MMRTLLAAIALIGSVGVAASATLDASLIQTSGEPSVGSGKFYGYRTSAGPKPEGPGDDAFTKAKDKAVAEGVPLVVVWSDDSCSHCDEFIRQLNENKAEVTKWLASKEAVFTFFKDKLAVPTASGSKIEANHSVKACWDAWNFAVNTCGAQALWPLYAFYYKTAAGYMKKGTSKDDSGLTRTWATFKAEFDEWEQKSLYLGGKFVASGTEFDRYEADPDTGYIDVELVRDPDKTVYAYKNRLDVTRPGETAAWISTNVEWAVSETSKTVRVSLVREEGEEFLEGEMALKLYDKYGVLKATTPIFCSKSVENSNVNPLKIGERDAGTLEWGEWTIDLNVATSKVAAAEGDAYTLVSVQGSKWCPDCAKTDANFLDLADAAGTNRFRAWARERHVALAVVDVPNYGAKLGTETETCASPSLFSKNAYTANRALRSGRGYLSRKMISDEEARALREWSHFLASTNTDKGGFHRPEDTNAYRTGVPIFVMLRKDGSVAARLIRFATESPGVSDRGNWDNYIKRFDEMLELASCSSEIDDNHWSTTKSEISSSKPITSSVRHVDISDVAKVKDVSVGSHVRLSLASESTNAVFLAINAVAGGSLKKLAEAYGPIGGLSVETDVLSAADGWFASVSCENTANGFSVGEQTSTVAQYTLSEECYLQPQQKAETNVPDGDTVVIRVVEGELYRFDGLVLPVDGLEPAEDGLYRATKSADLTLELADGATEIMYQHWCPGRIEFDGGERTVYTHMGDVELSVVRTGGVSGKRTETVRLVSADEHSAGRYVWAADVPVTWEDGEGGAKPVPLVIPPPGDVMHSTGTLVFGVGDSRLVVTLMDTDAPGLELLDYAAETYRYFSSGISFGAINLFSGGYVSVRVLSGSVPSGTRLAYDGESGELKLLGEPVLSGDYEFTVALAEFRDGRLVTGPASTVRVSVADADGINPYLAKARPNETLPLYVGIDGTNFVAGTLSVAVTSRGRISAKYMGTEARTASFSGSWQELDEGTGTASATLERSGCTLDLSMDKAGALSARLRVPASYSCLSDGSSDMSMEAGSAWPKEDPLNEYKGIYNVALPVDRSTRFDAPCGIGVFTLRMASDAAAKAGRFSYSGFMPDGTPVNGSATAVRTSDYGKEVIRLPVFRRIGKHVFSATFAIDPKAADNWDDEDEPLKREVVHLAGGTAALSIHRDTAWEHRSVHAEAIGSYYLPGVSPLKLSEMYNADDYGRPIVHRLRFVADGVSSPVFGPLSVPEAQVAPTSSSLALGTAVKGLSFSFKPSTGVFNGAAVIAFVDGNGKTKKATGSYRGVLTPGWTKNCDCGGDYVPEWFFGSGFLRYRDFNSEGRAVFKSIPVTLAPVMVNGD